MLEEGLAEVGVENGEDLTDRAREKVVFVFSESGRGVDMVCFSCVWHSCPRSGEFIQGGVVGDGYG